MGLGAPTLTPRVARVAGRAGSTTAFAEAAVPLEEELGVAVSSETVRWVSEAVGAVAEAEQQASSAQAQQGRWPRPAQGAVAVVVAVDGCQVPLDDGWHEMKVARVAPLGPARRHDARSGRTFLAWGPSVCCAGLESAEDFWYRVYVTACRGGLSQQTRRVVVLGAGAEWYWVMARSGSGSARRTLSADRTWRWSRLSTSITPMSTSGPWGALGHAEAVSAWVEPR